MDKLKGFLCRLVTGYFPDELIQREQLDDEDDIDYTNRVKFLVELRETRIAWSALRAAVVRARPALLLLGMLILVVLMVTYAAMVPR